MRGFMYSTAAFASFARRGTWLLAWGTSLVGVVLTDCCNLVERVNTYDAYAVFTKGRPSGVCVVVPHSGEPARLRAGTGARPKRRPAGNAPVPQSATAAAAAVRSGVKRAAVPSPPAAPSAAAPPHRERPAAASRAVAAGASAHGGPGAVPRPVRRCSAHRGGIICADDAGLRSPWSELFARVYTLGSAAVRPVRSADPAAAAAAACPSWACWCSGARGTAIWPGAYICFRTRISCP